MHSQRKSKFTKNDIILYSQRYFAKHLVSPKIKDVGKFPFSKNRVNALFDTWNNMLLCANLPLNVNPARKISCTNCKKEFAKQVKEIRKSANHFCSASCNATFYNTGRKHSEATKQKISESLKSHRIFI
jgi:hypothetical protein